MEDITDADYMHMNGACKDFEIKLQKNCLKTYHLDPVKFLSARGLAW